MQNKLNINELLINDEFIDWVNNPNIDNSRKWLELMKSSIENKNKIEEAKKIVSSFNNITSKSLEEEKSEKEILSKWNSILEKSTTKKKSYSWMKYAAMVVIFLSVAGTIYKTNFSNSVISNDTPLSYDNIVVTFSDGEVVEINNEGETSVTTNNGKIIEAKDGELRINNSEYASNLNWQAIKVPRGRKIAIFLSDGTKVHLNSDTELIYPSEFGDDERLVKLKGEAFFEVAHNKAKPFIVENNSQKVTVLGTKFNVSCYEDESSVKTTLVEGSVKINSKLKPESIILVPGEQSFLATDGSVLKKENVDVKYYTSWTKEVMYFKGEELGKLAIKLERWYDVKISFQSEESKRIKFTGVVRKEKSISHIMKLIETTSEIKITSNKDEIIIN